MVFALKKKAGKLELEYKTSRVRGFYRLDWNGFASREIKELCAHRQKVWLR